MPWGAMSLQAQENAAVTPGKRTPSSPGVQPKTMSNDLLECVELMRGR